MAIRHIRLFPDPVLSRPCCPALMNYNNLTTLVQDLRDTLYASPGVGLAAPQIGIAQQVCVLDISRKKSSHKKHIENTGDFLILINPKLIEGKGWQVPREGCLSVPDLLANVKRFQYVKVKTLTPDRQERVIEAEGFGALALQHEIDHLSGILFLDRVVNIKTDIFRRKNY